MDGKHRVYGGLICIIIIIWNRCMHVFCRDGADDSLAMQIYTHTLLAEQRHELVI